MLIFERLRTLQWQGQPISILFHYVNSVPKKISVRRASQASVLKTTKSDEHQYNHLRAGKGLPCSILIGPWGRSQTSAPSGFLQSSRS